MAHVDGWSAIARVYHPLSCGSIDGTDDFPHDQGIIRALNSKYKPNKQVQGDPLCTVFVGRLNPDTTEDTLLKVFEEFGSIKNLRLVRDIISGFSKRYAFIEYKSGSSAREAASRANKMRVDDRELLVDMECERELQGWIPRRLGGGFGGKKESGQLRFGGKDRPFKKPIALQRVQNPPYNPNQSNYESARQPRRRSRSRSPYKSSSSTHRRDNRDSGYQERYTDRSTSLSQHRESGRYRREKRDRSRSQSPERKKSKHKSHKERNRSRSRERHKKKHKR